MGREVASGQLLARSGHRDTWGVCVAHSSYRVHIEGSTTPPVHAPSSHTIVYLFSVLSFGPLGFLFPFTLTSNAHAIYVCTCTHIWELWFFPHCCHWAIKPCLGQGQSSTRVSRRLTSGRHALLTRPNTKNILGRIASSLGSPKRHHCCFFRRSSSGGNRNIPCSSVYAHGSSRRSSS